MAHLILAQSLLSPCSYKSSNTAQRDAWVFPPTHHARSLKSFEFSSLVTLSDAESAVAEMLTNLSFDTSDFKLLCEYLSMYVNRTGIAVRKNQPSSLSLTLVIHVIIGIVRSVSLVARGVKMEFSESCLICTEDLTFSDEEEIISISCSHIFHMDCLRQWTDCGGDCPLCCFAAWVSLEQVM